jgi:hypothetical protein
MPHDPNELLTLADQLRLLMQQGMAEDEAKARLGRLFAFRGQTLYSPKFYHSYEDPAIDWETGRVVLRRWLRHEVPRRLPRQPRRFFTPTLTAAAHYALFPLTGDARQLTAKAETDAKNRPIPTKPHTPNSAAPAADGNVIPLPYRTGTAGRPTSWSLIEAECRRQYAEGHRHPNVRTKIESPAEWARELIAWLEEAHKGAPVLKEKTLTNKLGALLRKLEREAPSPTH